MKITQKLWTRQEGWRVTRGADSPNAGLVLVFSTAERLDDPDLWAELHRAFPRARIAGCSTAGEIEGVHVREDSVVVTAIELEAARVEARKEPIAAAADSAGVGRRLAASLSGNGLSHVLVLSDGLAVNGSELVRGLSGTLPPNVAVTGGLAGDGGRFARTVACLDGPSHGSQVVAVGLYGERLRVGYGSLGGWDTFGPVRRVTRSAGNVLAELDGRSALALYEEYLGEHSAALPASGLLFPLQVWRDGDARPVVRTLLAVDGAAGTMTFAGDVPQGARAQLMRANFERLVEGAHGAATTAREALAGRSAELAILISCVGRKLVLQQRIEEEVEGVRDVLGERAVLTGFYSYGEISPFTPEARCELHNQTMTVTTLSEVP